MPREPLWEKASRPITIRISRHPHLELAEGWGAVVRFIGRGFCIHARRVLRLPLQGWSAARPRSYQGVPSAVSSASSFPAAWSSNFAASSVADSKRLRDFAGQALVAAGLLKASQAPQRDQPSCGHPRTPRTASAPSDEGLPPLRIAPVLQKQAELAIVRLGCSGR